MENENRRLRGRVQRLESQIQEIHGSNSWKLLTRLGSARSMASSKATALLGRARSRD